MNGYAEGDVPAFADRFTRVEIAIDNSVVYDTYQVTFPTVANPASANSMQVAEIELLGQKARIDVSNPSSEVVGSSDNTPAAEIPALAIDNDSATKYLNFDAGAENGNLPTGLTVTTGESVVTGLGLTSANDAPERDPATYEVWGSTDGAEFVLIASGDVPAFADRFTRVEANFHNAANYSVYQITFPTVADPIAANSMQIAEVELLGELQAPSVDAPTLSISRDGANIVLEWTGLLEMAETVEGPWVEVSGAVSPMTIEPGDQLPMEFARARGE